MISISSHKLEYNIELYKLEIENHLSDVREKIKEWIDNNCIKSTIKFPCLNDDQKRYLYFLNCQLDKIVYSDLKKLKRYQVIFDNIISEENKKSSQYKVFKDKLITIMGYQNLRSYKESSKTKPIYPRFFKDLGIKVCVYCNSQLTITTIKENTQSVARFQVDHYLDKSSYPCFSISFYNLYPVCSPCNNKKGRNDVKFDLYSNKTIDTAKSNFEFSIDRSSIAEFRLSRDEASLKINFDDKNSSLNKYFAIKEVYDTQKDLAAEIIIKSEIYNTAYKKTLQNSFSKLYGKGKSSINFSRIILGNYTDPKEIHKRPMSKFTQDIAKQLGLI